MRAENLDIRYYASANFLVAKTPKCQDDSMVRGLGCRSVIDERGICIGNGCRIPVGSAESNQKQ